MVAMVVMTIVMMMTMLKDFEFVILQGFVQTDKNKTRHATKPEMKKRKIRIERGRERGGKRKDGRRKERKGNEKLR